ncbi:hypothetical protein ACFXB3_18150 [Streptomyces sp. NPDC059447]|uniref:hypothetical protein n=1 Tax=Streptomyces sp. NPDC059447 TaxID=3346834 RepID=UPI0036848520
MVTARAASRAPRTRRPAGPLRLLWLATLLFAFLYTHAAGADTASAHVTGGAVTAAEAYYGEPAPDGGEEDGGHGHGHPAEACASGHPPQGVDLPEPPSDPLGEPAASDCAARTPWPWARTSPAALPAMRSSVGSMVQRI